MDVFQQESQRQAKFKAPSGKRVVAVPQPRVRGCRRCRRLGLLGGFNRLCAGPVFGLVSSVVRGRGQNGGRSAGMRIGI